MNILFLTLFDMTNLNEHGLYQDLLQEFLAHGHNISIIVPNERRNNDRRTLIKAEGYQIVRVKMGNIQKTNVIEKGISTILIENKYKKAIRKYFSDTKFDLVLYSTPPITFAKVISYIKRRDGAQSYLLLKDIFPQNAVDLGMLSQKGLLYWFFRKKEQELYVLSDMIGCMSPANVQYLLSHNKNIDPNKVEVCPNSIKVRDICLSLDKKLAMRDKYGLPKDKTVFVYGGNLGKPQGIPFMIECLKAQKNNQQAFFIIAGSGTERNLIEKFIEKEKPDNVKLLPQLPRDEFDLMIACCDVGLVFLDHRFTIPNFPSRLLAYMQAKLPVLACTDPNTDIGKTIVEGGFGWWCESNSTEKFTTIVNDACCSDLRKLGHAAHSYLTEHYMVDKCYEIIMEKLKDENYCE